MTPELRRPIMAAETLTALEDLYQPYKPKRRTRAGIAREKGPARAGGSDPAAGAHQRKRRDSWRRAISTSRWRRSKRRWPGRVISWLKRSAITLKCAAARAKKPCSGAWSSVEKLTTPDDPRRVYELYYDFEFRVDRLRPHQVLAINRGEEEKVLRVKVGVIERGLAGSGVYVLPPRPALAVL